MRWSERTLKRSRDFDRVFKQGRSCATKELVLFSHRRSRGHGRVGFCISRKLGNAVARNRLRRRLREVYRLACEKLSPRWDVVLLARQEALHLKFQELQEIFLELARRAKILNPPGPSDAPTE